MNIENLIENLRYTDSPTYVKDHAEEAIKMLNKAADALEALQAENISLRAERDALLKSVKALSAPIEVIPPRGITE